MTNSTYEETKEAVIMAMALVVTTKLMEEDLISKPNNMETEEERYAAVLEGIELIKEETNKAFRPEEEAQEMKKVVTDYLVEHHFKYYGYEVDGEAGE